MHSFFFLLSHLPLLLVLFKGILKCCRLCAITQSYRFSVTKALYQRMWNQGKDIFFPFTDKRKLLCFQASQKTNPTCCQNKTKSLFLMFLFSMHGLKRSFGRTIYLKSRFPKQTKNLFQFNYVLKNSLHYLTL